MDTTVLTGANGFVGSNLSRRLLDEGLNPMGVVRETSDLTFIEGLDLDLAAPGLERVEPLVDIFEGADVVFHCASLTGDWGPMEDYKKANVENTENVVRAAARAGVSRLVYVGSTVVFGFDGNVNTPETAEKDPEPFPYCVTKLEAEQLVQSLSRELDLEYSIIRPGNVYGPRDRVTSMKLFPFLEDGKFVHVDGGTPLTCPTYVGNLVDALLLVARKEEAAHRDYNITDGLEITWEEYIDVTCEKLDVDPPGMGVPSLLAYPVACLMEGTYTFFGAEHPPPITRYRIKQVSHDYHFSIDRARRELGYQPRVGLEEGLRRTVDWYRDYASDD